MDSNKISNDQMMENGKTSNENHNIDGEAEYVPLPSKGIFYKGPFKGMDKLLVRKLGWQDEDILTTKSYYDNGTLFTEIIKNCVVDSNGFSGKDLIPADRDVILWWLRIGAFGQEYDVNRTCPNQECKKKHKVTWDLGSFNEPETPKEFEEELNLHGYVTLTLPVSGCQIKITTPSVSRELELQKSLTIKREKEKISRELNTTGKLLSVIIEATGKDGTVYNNSQIMNFLTKEKLSIVDSRYIQTQARKINFEVDTKQDITCPHCNNTEEGVRMPMSITFFWPEFTEI